MKDEIIDRIKKEASLYLNGLSLRQISKELGLSHVTVHYDLTNRLAQISGSLYNEVCEKLESNMPKSIKNPDVLKRVLTSYKLLVNDNKTVEEISKELNVPFFIVYRDLHTRIVAINKIAPEIMTTEMLELAQKILSFHSTHSEKSLSDIIKVNKLK